MRITKINNFKRMIMFWTFTTLQAPVSTLSSAITVLNESKSSGSQGECWGFRGNNQGRREKLVRVVIETEIVKLKGGQRRL